MAMWRGGILRAASRLHPPVRSGFEGVSCRAFAEQAEEEPKDIVKEKFIEKLELLFNLTREFRKFRIVIDPDDPKVVKELSDNILQARSNVGLPPPEVQLQNMMEGLAQRSKSVRQFYEKLGRFQASKGMEDVEGNKAMMEVIDAVESKIGKPLTRDDKEGMKLFEEQSAAALKRLDTDPEKFDEYMEQRNLDKAKLLLLTMKKGASETIDRFMKDKTDFELNYKELDARTFLRLPGEGFQKPAA
ncbi:hypothetical protein SELMODRAFT_422590 [Selaginella moellendorffii]|uniref:Uncharacterized protein n=1 Tax=Selaginella moellendorffii TaxID=88036 RepID=D8SIX4_SELML|nr:uncharacterized protein LOC9654768 [Selaginella moellendorffii]EFJ15571.1 hypothetical protein SELMODRAFT_422590 [Selaginella moellendorffii]|eukprot:XP_002983229.1 uncharacterized protein LOC9654768 [Selaginella moellendorffii]